MRIRRHLFLRHLGMTLGVLGAVFILLTLGQFADTARFIGGEGGVSAFQLLWRAALRAPALLQHALPHALVLSTVMLLHQLGESRELAALAGTGLSAPHILLPLAVSGVIVGSGFVFVASPFASIALAHAEAFEREVLGLRVPVRSRHIAVQTGQGITYVFAGAVAPEGDQLQEVTLFELDQGHQLIKRVDFARATRTGALQWSFESYVEARGTERAQPVPPPGNLPFDADLLSGTLAHHHATAIYDLPAAAALAVSVAAQPLPYRFQFHWLVALPALLGAMSFAAGAIGFHLRPGQPLMRRALDVVLLGLPFYVLSTVIEAFAIRGLVPLAPAVWALPAILLLTGLAVVRLRRL